MSLAAVPRSSLSFDYSVASGGALRTRGQNRRYTALRTHALRDRDGPIKGQLSRPSLWTGLLTGHVGPNRRIEMST
jgi:hypothetical protein